VELAGQVQTDDYDAAFNVTGDPDPFITYSSRFTTPRAASGRVDDFPSPWSEALERVSASVSLAAVGGRGGFDIGVSG